MAGAVVHGVRSRQDRAHRAIAAPKLVDPMRRRAQLMAVLLEEIARTSVAVAATSSRLAKIERLADCLRRLTPEEVRVAVHYLSGELPQGTIGVGWASLKNVP